MMKFITAFATALSLVVAACGTDASGPATTIPDSAQMVGTSSDPLQPPSEAEHSIVIELDDVKWRLPESVCLSREGDALAVENAALEKAAEVQALVAGRASGWPTTTAPYPGSDAEFFVAVNRSGPTALVLSAVAGTTDAITAGWMSFEQRYADPAQGWGPVTDISSRLSSWQRTAQSIVEALAVGCA